MERLRRTLGKQKHQLFAIGVVKILVSKPTRLEDNPLVHLPLRKIEDLQSRLEEATDGGAGFSNFLPFLFPFRLATSLDSDLATFVCKISPRGLRSPCFPHSSKPS
jgi:hypothetical protein